MNCDSNQNLYDHAFFPSKWVPLLVGIGSLVFVGMFIFIFIKHGPEWSTILGLCFFGFCFIVSIFLAFWFSRKVTVGVNRNGIFIWRYGVVPWGQVKGFELWQFGYGKHAQNCILISLHDPDSFFARLSALLRWGRLSTKKRVPIMQTNVAICLKKLLPILQNYHRDIMQNG